MAKPSSGRMKYDFHLLGVKEDMSEMLLLEQIPQKEDAAGDGWVRTPGHCQ